MTEYEEIQEVVYSNYEELRVEILNKYNVFAELRENNESIFYFDITKQFMDMIHSIITRFIVSRSLLNFETVKLYVESRFTFDNIERIISEEGKV